MDARQPYARARRVWPSDDPAAPGPVLDLEAMVGLAGHRGAYPGGSAVTEGAGAADASDVSATELAARLCQLFR